MKKIINLTLVVTLYVFMQLGEYGHEKAREKLIDNYMRENPSYSEVIKSREFRSRNLLPAQEETIKNHTQKIAERINFLQITKWAYILLLAGIFSVVFEKANRSTK